MKKFITALTALLMLTLTVKAMSYSEAREQALFLTDKMAYELNLSEEQYDAAYEVNLDYLMSINTYDDLYGAYWRARNTDLSYILMDWQYRAFCAANYFYRPLYWTSGVWHFAIYSRYPRRNYFYFGRPNIYVTYRGGHCWRSNGGRSWYRGRTFNHGGNGFGMRDRFDRGDFRPGRDGWNRPGDRGFDRGRNDRGFNNDRGGWNDRSYRGYRNNDNRPGRGFSNDNRNGNNGDRPGRGFGNDDQNRNTGDRPTRGFGTQRFNRESSTRMTARPSMGDFSTRRSVTSAPVQTPSRTFTPSGGQTRSFNQGGSAPSRSFGGSNSTRNSGGSRGGSFGGGSFGGRR